MFGGVADDPGARRRPHRLPADARRQPARVERQPADRARHARAAARDPRARRQGRRGRPAAHAHRRGRRRAPLHPARHRRATCCSRSSTCSSPRAWSTRAGWPSTSTALDDGPSRSRADFTPEAVARGDRHRGRRRSARMARELAARRARRGLRPHRHHARRSSARSRAGSSTCSTSLTGNLDRPGGAMFPRAAAGAAQHAGRARPRAAACGSGAGVSRVRGLPEALGELPVAVPGRGDRDAGRRPDPRADHASPATPCSRTPELRPARRGARARSTSWSRRHLPQRDDAPRRRDPARRRRRSQRSHYDLALLPASRAQRRELLAGRARRSSPASRTSGETLLRLAGIVAGQGPDADVDALDDMRRARGRRERRDGSPSTAATPTSCWPRSSRASGPSGCSTSCCASGPTATLDARADLEAGARTAIDLGPLEPRLPEVLRTPSGKIELAPPSRSSPTSSACAPRSTRRAQRRHGAGRPARAALQQLVDAQPRRCS